LVGLPFSAENSDAGTIGVHGDDKATDSPEDAVFDATDNPDPALGDFVCGRGRDQQMDKSDEPDVLQVDAKKQSNTKDGFNRSGDIHPCCRGFEAGLHKKIQRGRNRDLSNDVRNEKHCARYTQDIELVEQIEFVGKRHGINPPWWFVSGSHL
jgi:hypothetical protein